MGDEMNRVRSSQRREWQKPTVTAVGTVGEVLEGGQGKVTIVTGDPGEPKKVPATDK